MGREGSSKPNYEIIALVTLNSKRILGGKQLSLLAENEEEAKILTQDVAKAMKADVVQMQSGDYLVIRI
ncbi:MAG: capping complex subunit for YIEGIA [Peptococcaceae bacterium]